ncbi:MAG: bifunctional diaminohydroxyphosphoribosylaminopyrimidine deaminase/5-amino-6-(5-phosphoribosylamino)uracil reductase RibD [Planctomycetota bacterium]|nr:bifunctional diaminohydroxyphosphoribosylaminopyrimidine deaminase/5-amino-6-(5-phosphoribosylamino)uracil reductase RibD [Planctomycetota bacterium]
MAGLTQPLDAQSLGALLAELGVEARAHRFEVAPNPCVGAAVLAAGEVVARGYHRVWGQEHAEVDALRAARESGVPLERWDALVVTLEPCSSQGKTPPCTEAILAAGIGCVVVGSFDPDPRHRGKGIEQLRAAGLEVIVLEASPLENTSPQFLSWNDFERRRRPRPWIIAKWAQTLTGQLTPPKSVGEGRWISGSGSQAEVGLLRSRVDAIVTGIGTVLSDDPRLTVRPSAGITAPPARVVLDTALRTPTDARLFHAEPGEAAGPVHVVSLTGADFSGSRALALTEAGAQVHGLRGDDVHHLNLREVTAWLWRQGFRRVLLEAGPTLLASFLDAGFVDQVRVYTGPVPGGRGESLGSWLVASALEERLDRECGEDQVLEAFLHVR